MKTRSINTTPWIIHRKRSDLWVAEARLSNGSSPGEGGAIELGTGAQSGPQDGRPGHGSDAQLADAQAEWELLKNGPDPDEIVTRQKHS